MLDLVSNLGKGMPDAGRQVGLELRVQGIAHLVLCGIATSGVSLINPAGNGR